jgi:hypothetical protein
VSAAYSVVLERPVAIDAEMDGKALPLCSSKTLQRLLAALRDAQRARTRWHLEVDM